MNTQTTSATARAIAIGVAAAAIVLFIAAQAAKQNNADSSDNSRDSAGGFERLNNAAAPLFTLSDRNGNPISLEGLRGKTVVLFFNEGLMCYPACWNQVVSLSKDEELNTDAIVSYSVVVDAPAGWKRAAYKMPEIAAANVLFDEDRAVSRMYGMLVAPSSMHYGGYPGHTYVVIDPEGVVRFVYDDPSMSINNKRIKEEIVKLNRQS